MTLKQVLIIALVLFAISIFLTLLILIQKKTKEIKIKKNLQIQKMVMERFGLGKKIKINCSLKLFIHNFFLLSQKVQLTKIALDEAFEYFNKRKYIKKLINKLDSKNAYKRARSITYLSIFNNDLVVSALIERLKIERKEHIKIQIVNSLKNNLDIPTLKAIIASLIESRRYYQIRVIKILKKYIDQTNFDLSVYFSSPLIEIKESFIELAMQIYHPSFEEHLISTLKEIEDHYIYGNSVLLKNVRKERIDRLYYQTLTALSTYYDYDLSSNKYLANLDHEVAKIAANSLTNSNEFKTIELLLNYSSQTSKDIIYAEAIDKICSTNKEFYDNLYDLFKTNIDMRKKILIASVLSKRIDYLLLKIKDSEELEKLISIMIRSKYSVNIINWLNENKNLDMEKRIINIIVPIAKNNYEFYLELNDYLSPSIFKKMGFIQTKFPETNKPDIEPEIFKRRWLITILIISILSLPLIFFISNLNTIISSSFYDIFTLYVITINKWFIFYYLLANLIYIIMTVLAWFEYKRQERLWNIKSEDFLYEDGIISGISILVPAYNEELTIEESLKSLLNLKYPDYEVIVVNDGSKDETLKTIIEAFDLKRVDYYINKLIQTRPIKAVYKNKFYPKLTLIDKENGGKADSLNVGINFSKNDYVCGIDADSLIEADGLLKMMASVLDHDSITLALGGSIVPINGATVNHGYVEKYELPKTPLTRFQSIEYIRAFNAGRLGFSKLKCFLIISGAFGLFEKRLLIEIGGYLTASTMKKDTVGEDMELVVRITEKACEKNLDYRTEYIPMARCYTEVPNERKSLFSQRNRWQRGLIDTLSFHRKMIFNRKYRTSGTIALPYYFVFEMVAPVLELQVYLTILLGLVFGIFNAVFLALLLVVTTLLGMVISLISLLIQEKYAQSLNLKDTLLILLYAIIENLGWRQLISMYRARGFFSSLKDKHSWGKMKRTGFKKEV